ncbi:MMPL family transporter [Nitrosomonas sp.]|uniref:MMPL family transporter n=1 Tax=Nitrosomonas sp. TaxID=42353 RepID=UPI00262E9D8E|nr:MMPL family transporter [Nitrosomonas sp.]MCW5600687.1 MMPL family transporter [Nitrosomonas sp.]
MEMMGARFGIWLEKMERNVLHFPKTLILLVLMLCALSLHYAAGHLGIDTDTTKMLSEELPFRQDRERLVAAFPQDEEAALVVIDAEIPEKTTEALSYLGERFRAEEQHIESVFIPGEGEFFDRHGLLYLKLEELNELADTLAEAQPFVGTLAEDNSLKGLLSIIELAITTEGRELPVDLNPLLEKISQAMRAAQSGEQYQLSWQQMIFGDDAKMLTTQRFIVLQPKLDYSALVPTESALTSIRSIVEEAKAQFPEVRIRLTGEVVLEHDELESVESSATMASIFSLILVCLTLLIGLRSLRLVLITFVVLLMGLALTVGFATFAIGHLNLISISFAVLYIGIGVDYAIQISLRYRELLRQNLTQFQALMEAVHKVAPSIALCALTAAAGFFSFMPTAYVGVSELGVIAGGGMFIALIISLTVLPALLILFPLNPATVKLDQSTFPQWVYHFPMQHRTAIKWTAISLTLVSIALLTQVRFDFNPLNLRDPDSESLSTFRELLDTKQTSPFTLTVLAHSKEESEQTAQRLAALGSVENAITVLNFVPESQEEKLAVLQDLSLMLGLPISTFPPVLDDTLENHKQALERFLTRIEESLAADPANALAGSLRQLRDDVKRLLKVLETLPEAKQAALLDQLQNSLLGTLKTSMDRLLQGLLADVVSLDALPKDLLERWLNADGVYRVQAFPRKNLNDHENLKEFIADVRTVSINATDLPVIYLESGNAVVEAFQKALIGALLAISAVLLVMHRNIKDASLILLPLLMMSILTAASTVLLDNPFNFANIIVIPLLMGLGVNSGIYIMLRLRAMPDREQDVLNTSTARAVVFCNLTTLCSFVSMAFTPHLGLASMGLLLSTGLILIILTSLLVLPAFACKPLKPSS